MELFDEVREKGRWILGRRRDSYVAIWRHSLQQNDCSTVDQICDAYYYSEPFRKPQGQVWVAVVGNNVTHSDFDSFETIVSQGKVSENVQFTPFFGVDGLTYKTSVKVDGKELSATLYGYVHGVGRRSERSSGE